MAAAFINRLLPGSDTTEGLDRLFAGPSSTATVDPAFAASTSGQGNASVQTNSLDEPISATIMRDLRRIYSNLVMVIVPFEFARYVDVEDEDVDDLASPGSRQTARRNQALKNWDLWGPMLFTIGLAIPLSIGTSKPSSTFSLVFGLISVGAIVLTVNVVLLGGSIGFLQSISLLGYCLAPLNVRCRRFSTVPSIDARPSHSSLLTPRLLLVPARQVAAVLFLFVRNPVVRWIVMPTAVAWASWASVPFIGGAVAKDKKVLAVYPLVLLYSVLGWLALIK